MNRPPILAQESITSPTLGGYTEQQYHLELIQKQQAFEESMLDRGAKRFREKLQAARKAGRETTTEGPGKSLLHASLLPVSEAFSAFVERTTGKAGRQNVATRFLAELGPEVAAFLTAKAILSSLSKRTRVSRAALNIAGLMVDELRYRRFHEDAPELFNWKLRNFNTTSYTHMKRSMDAALSFAQMEYPEYDLTAAERLHLGMASLNIFLKTTPFIEVYRVNTKRKKEAYLVPTEETQGWIRACEQRMEFLSPVILPCLIPPKPWSSSRDGGYWFGLHGSFTFMRVRSLRGLELDRTEKKMDRPWKQKHQQEEELDNLEMPQVYEAVNRMQDTAWAVNEPVLEVIERLKVLGREEAGVPSYTEEPLPAKPHDIDTNPEARKEWRNKASAVHERNYVRRSKAIAFGKILSTAKTLLGQKDSFGNSLPFYFPYNLDFRGRVYAIPSYLQPQGDDVSRGLLMFADGKPLDSGEAVGCNAAVGWLAVHGANCLAEIDGVKLDKLPLKDRMQWVFDHEGEIAQVARDPYTFDWWMSADKPFQFLAFCFEWEGFLKEGFSFKSRIPVSMDGSCNGLQHYSALLRDTTGGKAVNLVPSEKPNDIYQQVAQAVNERLLKDAEAGNESALAWVKWGRVDRKICKRPVMTLPYGARKYGFREQTAEFLKDKMDRKDWPEFFDPGEKKFGLVELAYFSDVLWETLESTVVSAIQGMEYFQALVRVLMQQDLPITWSVPTGLHIMQVYPRTEPYRVKTKLAGSVFMPQLLNTIPNSVDARKQVNGIAPNIIHSLDACALMLAVCEAGQKGITHFSMVHDSFGTHAADAAQLNRITRETFVGMYLENDILSDLENDLLSNLDVDKLSPDDLPERPKVGNLQLEAVLESDYFFA